MIDAIALKAASRLVDRVLDEVDFTAPVELDDVMTVHRRVVDALPEGYRVESHHRVHEVVFSVFVPELHDPVVQRIKKVT